MAFILLAQLGGDLVRFLLILFRSPAALVAENIALRTSAEVCARCHHKRRHLSDAKRVTLVVLDRLFGIRDQLVLIIPSTVRRWATKCGNLSFWLRCRGPGRPPLAEEARAIICRLARENPTWKVGTIARTATTQLGLEVTANTVRKYLPLGDPRRSRWRGGTSESWQTFIGNHANSLLAMDFAVQRTMFGSVLYVLVVMEIGTRRIIHTNVTAHPTAEWAAQQLREAIAGEHRYTHLIHDNDAIFSRAVDATIRSFGIEPVRTPIRAPRANGFCEQLIGTLRRECLDWIIPLGERPLRSAVREWALHYNRARPHMSLRLSVPEPNEVYPAPRLCHRHHVPAGSRVVSTSVLGGLHHEYRLEQLAA
jgi:transposase InsO family protein